ncbi:MAG TPA: iron ABC transporter substrate-binding protein [Gaiellaceae bacterium]|nr:iron ABC transporter substrate-binding protein [Gaiellaceae bacterium]
MLLALCTAFLASCGGGRDALTIYSGRSENLVGPLLEQFAEEQDLAIDVRYGDSTDLALLLAEEGDRTPADVFLSQSPGTVGFLAERGALAPLAPDTLEAVPSQFESASGLWLGVSARRRVLVYDSEQVSPSELPQSVFELTEPEYRGRVGVAPSNASFQDFVSAMRQVEGDERTEDWLSGMAANDAPTYANNNAIVEAVSRGEIPFGLVNHYYNERFLAEDPGLPSRNYVFPDGDLGSIPLVTTVSVLAGSERTEDAQRFVEFLLSPEAQRFYSEETFEYPLAAGVEPAAGLEPLADDVELPYDIEELGAELESTARMIADSGLEE